MTVEGKSLAVLAVSVSVDVDDTGGCLLETALTFAAFVSHNDLIILYI